MSGTKGKSGGKRKGSGRKKIPVDYDVVEKLAKMMCTQSEIATFLGCSVNKLEKDKKFQEAHNKGLEQGKMSIRRKQIEIMNDGNATMGIWLGKQYLGQRDKQEIEVADTTKIKNREERQKRIKKLLEKRESENG